MMLNNYQGWNINIIDYLRDVIPFSNDNDIFNALSNCIDENNIGAIDVIMEYYKPKDRHLKSLISLAEKSHNIYLLNKLIIPQ